MTKPLLLFLICLSAAIVLSSAKKNAPKTEPAAVMPYLASEDLDQLPVSQPSKKLWELEEIGRQKYGKGLKPDELEYEEYLEDEEDDDYDDENEDESYSSSSEEDDFTLAYKMQLDKMLKPYFDYDNLADDLDYIEEPYEVEELVLYQDDDLEAALDQTALQEAQSAKNVVIVHETVNVGKIEVNPVPFQSSPQDNQLQPHSPLVPPPSPPLTDLDIVQAMPLFDAKPINLSPIRESPSDEVQEPKAEPPHSPSYDAAVSAQNEERKRLEKMKAANRVNSFEDSTEDSEEQPAYRPNHDFFHHIWVTLPIVNVCLIILTLILVAYVARSCYQFCKHVSSSSSSQGPSDLAAVPRISVAKEVKIPIDSAPQQ